LKGLGVGAIRSTLPGLALCAGLACSTGDPDTAPAEAGRIQRTTAHVDSAMEPARGHIRTIDSLGESVE
jgi:hypothetical protein